MAERASEVIARLKQQVKVVDGEKKIIQTWRDMLPPGSRWQPGSPGKPDCKECMGTGFVRLDLPVGHPYFGKVLLCDCAK